MVITEQKPLIELLKSLEGYNKIFIVGCGECSTTCKTGGEKEVLQVKEVLEKIKMERNKGFFAINVNPHLSKKMDLKE